MSICSRVGSYVSVPFKCAVPTALVADGFMNAGLAFRRITSISSSILIDGRANAEVLRIASMGFNLLNVGLLLAGFAEVYSGSRLMRLETPDIQKKRQLSLDLSTLAVPIVYAPLTVAVNAGINYVLPKSAPLLARVAIGIVAQTSSVTIAATALVMTAIFFVRLASSGREREHQA